jgi:hypothetical protein
VVFYLFVGWYLHIDGAPWWLWVVFGLAAAFEQYEERWKK